jgi:hypothetical protein
MRMMIGIAWLQKHLKPCLFGTDLPPTDSCVGEEILARRLEIPIGTDKSQLRPGRKQRSIQLSDNPTEHSVATALDVS